MAWNDKQAICKNCKLFTDCISKINKIEADNGKILDFLMPIYNLLEYWKMFKNIPEFIPTLQRWAKRSYERFWFI